MMYKTYKLFKWGDSEIRGKSLSNFKCNRYLCIFLHACSVIY